MDLAAWQHVGPSLSRDQTRVSCIATWILYHWATGEAWSCLYWRQYHTVLITLALWILKSGRWGPSTLFFFFFFFKPQYSSITPQLWRFLSSYYSVCGPAWGPSPTQNQATRQIKSGSFLESVESEPCEKDDLEMASHPSPGDTRMFFFKVLAILGPFEKFHINFTMRYSSSPKAKQRPTGILFRPVDQFELPRWH